MANAKKAKQTTVKKPKVETPREAESGFGFWHSTKTRYDHYMPNKKHHRVFMWVVFFVVSITVAGQLLYPPDRALPLSKIADQNVAWRDHDSLVEEINKQFQDSRIKLVIDGGTSIEAPLASAGAEVNTEKVIDEVIDYPFWKRFVPLSIFFGSNSSTKANVYYTDNVLRDFGDEQAKALSHEPVNASLAIKDGKLIATDDKAGQTVEAEAVYQSIVEADLVLGGLTTVVVGSTRVEPDQTSDSLNDVRSMAEAALDRQVSVVADGQSFTPERTEVASWLEIVSDESNKPTLKVSEDNLTKFFDSINAKVGISAGQTNINMVDGQETSRTKGQSGRAIDRADLKAKISNWILKGEGSGDVEAVFYEVAPSIIYNSKYTSSQAGLQAYLNDTAGRMNVSIAVLQVDGGRWSASVGASRSMPSASTYKLYVAKWLFDQMDKGKIKWSDPMLDTDVSTCFDRMTIASTNPCAEAWLAQAGRQDFNNYLYGLGFSRGTDFTRPDATHSTANDLQKMMLGIYNGTLIKGANKDRLLKSLSTHPYQYGIGAGSGGKVYDKVGFLWDYVHDTAIVYHPKGTYIMTIMTKGQSYATIASITREIEKIMYP